MTKQTINRGTAANDGTGDNLRAGAAKINENFDELYTVLGDGTTLLSGDYITTSSSSILTNKSILAKIEFMSTKIQRITGVILIIFSIKLLFSIQWKSIRFKHIFWYGDRYE